MMAFFFVPLAYTCARSYAKQPKEKKVSHEPETPRSLLTSTYNNLMKRNPDKIRPEFRDLIPSSLDVHVWFQDNFIVAKIAMGNPFFTAVGVSKRNKIDRMRPITGIALAIHRALTKENGEMGELEPILPQTSNRATQQLSYEVGIPFNH